ncbi:protein kinase [Streptomyces pseudovenezuelae]|uniref:Serine/threonine protein kinase n=1 Tax=Streptomyces pseudovenezuelae TaxID=67350 RepID=A0ABT6LME2_9ACTN|nr:protein kinase [Streptomyces pseudovenezuelae]MDH6217479.1 serine/threonine protein kinase [Streptomyces pseudovenezuelae]
MDEYAGRVLADRYRLPLPPSDEYELTETRAFDTYSGQEVLVRQVPLPEVVEAEVLDAEGLPEGFTARDRGARRPAARGGSRRPADPAVRRAVDAAQAAARIPDHPRLDQVFDVFAEGGSLWIVSELVPARPLAALLAEKPLTPYRAAEVASDVLMALRVLHAHGWVHRNITARTVLVCDDGRVMLTGLAVGAAEEALCGYDPVPPPEDDGAGGGGIGSGGGVGSGPQGAAGHGHLQGLGQGQGSRSGAGQGLGSSGGSVGQGLVGAGGQAGGPGGSRGGVGGRGAGALGVGDSPGVAGSQGGSGGAGAGGVDPEAARRAAINARAAGGLPPAGTETAANGTGTSGALAPKALEGGGDIRAARAGAIAAYRAGARAAARVQEAQQHGRAALPGARPAPEVGPGSQTNGSSQPYPSEGGVESGPGGGPPPGQIADPYGVGGTSWHGATPRGATPVTEGQDRTALPPGGDPGVHPGGAPGTHPGDTVGEGPAAYAPGPGAGGGPGFNMPPAPGAPAPGLGAAPATGVPTPGTPGFGEQPMTGPGQRGPGTPGAGTRDLPGPGQPGSGVGVPGQSGPGVPGRPGFGTHPDTSGHPDSLSGAPGLPGPGSHPGHPGHPGAHRGAPGTPALPSAGHTAPGFEASGPGAPGFGGPGPTAPGYSTQGLPASGTTPSTQPAHPPNRWDDLRAEVPARRGPATPLAAERARQARMAVVGPVTERWAPEQAGPVHENWQLAAPIGPATDLWALGALLYRAVQGHAPYPEESTAELVQMVCAEPPAFAEECGPLRPVVESLLRQDPTERLEFEELRGWLRSLVRSAPEAEAGVNVVAAPPADSSRLPIVRRRGELVRRRRAGLPATSPHGRHKRAKEEAKSPRHLGRILLLLILLLLAGAVAYALMFMPKSGDDGATGGDRTGAAGEASPEPKRSDVTASSEPRPDQTSPKAEQTPSKSASASASETATSGPDVGAGFTLRKDPEGFQVAVAKGWTRTPKNSWNQVVYSHGDFQLVLVPGRDGAVTYGSDPMAYQRDTEHELQPYRTSSWATATGLKTITVGERAMAEGQFTWSDDSGRDLFVRNLAILINGRYHVVQVRGPESERDEVTRLYEQASATYEFTR